MSTTKITRRSLLASGTAAAVIAAPATTQAAGISAKQRTLIETHRTLFAAWVDTIDPREEVESAYDAYQEKIGPQIVPCLLGGGHGIKNGREESRKFIADAYRSQRDRLPNIARLDPDMANRMRELLDAKEAENLALVETAYDEEDARQEAFGLTAAVNAYDDTCDAMEGALLELLSYRCQSIEDERARALYLVKNRGVFDIVLMDSNFTKPFLRAVAGLEEEV